jgi:uncharacterized protein
MPCIGTRHVSLCRSLSARAAVNTRKIPQVQTTAEAVEKIRPDVIAFDIDGVVADTMGLFIEIAAQDFGMVGIRYENITSYTLEACEQLAVPADTIRDIIGRILDGTYRATLAPIEGAARVLQRISASASPLRFVTARPYLGPIHQWFQRTMRFHADQIDIVATGSFEAKADILLQKGILYFVEDRLETCFLLASAGLRPILFRQPWNRKPHPFPEVANWDDLEAMIDFRS